MNYLFNELLNKDILNGVVFPAIRNGVIDFYYKGGRLFSYDCKKNVFLTHTKYASVYDTDKKYISENELTSLEHIKKFGTTEAYERIKENCSLFSGDEASGVSEVYSKYSILNKNNKSDICVLDIEISFEKENESMDNGSSNKGQDRIDLLVYNKKEGKLRFYEAKHFTNGELWSSKGTPKVIKQLERYNKQLRNKDILNVYQGYIKTLNNLFKFDTKISEPTELDVNVVLLVFGFDRNQLDGKLRPFLYGDKGYKDIPHYYVGNIKTVNMKSLWG